MTATDQGLCYTVHKHQAHLWDESLDSSGPTAKRESPQMKRFRRSMARGICQRCPLSTTCEYKIE
ncbi:hypothetical protein SEA_CHEWYVIII_65 [Rhodococcus phage ChewyVIII]|uniref:Uncharacterized protein n=1 Tax=Rhodococcus phage ChewyVIII TaxID=1887657 RepID=A0A1C9EIA8_9CAUD|nr:hypothetical protein QEH30_gp65 [Rhodococcus phage ChewyVIII]AON97518.1 hypothetical protein SEA_CHEWYVIII_65 [Rhodococcus phage ChewyVIII]